MAVTANKMDTDLVLRIKVGVDENGKDIIRSKRFSKVKLDAIDDDLYAVAQAIGTVLNYPIIDITRVDDNVLLNV